jgi:hypothetical protein
VGWCRWLYHVARCYVCACVIRRIHPAPARLHHHLVATSTTSIDLVGHRTLQSPPPLTGASGLESWSDKAKAYKVILFDSYYCLGQLVTPGRVLGQLDDCMYFPPFWIHRKVDPHSLTSSTYYFISSNTAAPASSDSYLSNYLP